MVESVAAVLRELPPGAVRVLTYEHGRLTVELVGAEAALERIMVQLDEAGLRAETAPRSSKPGTAALILVVRPA
jgi:hypothetical protein